MKQKQNWIGRKFKVIKHCSGEYIQIGDIVEIAAIQDLRWFVKTVQGMTQISAHWHSLGHLEEETGT